MTFNLFQSWDRAYVSTIHLYFQIQPMIVKDLYFI